MKSSSLCCAILAVLVLATSAPAAHLCVTAVNLHGVPSTSGNGNILGTKVFTISLMFGADDIVPAGPTALLAGTFTIEGVDGGQIRQSTGVGVNRQTRQGVQDRIDQGTESPGTSNESLRNDSWWYASPDGNLVSNGIDPNTGDPIVTPLGIVWTPFSFGGGITGGVVQGEVMSAVMTYGPFPFTVAPSTIPLVQVRTTGNLLFGGEILIGTKGFTMAGGPTTGTPANNPKAPLSFQVEQFGHCIPEPSTSVLAGMGLIALTCLASKRRKEQAVD